MNRFEKWFCGVLAAVAIGLAVIGLNGPQSADAQGGYPLGADVVTSATNYWVTCTITNTAGTATAITSNIVVASMNPKRVRLTIRPDSTSDAYVNYGPFGDTNLTTSVTSSNVFLPLTNGWLLAKAAVNAGTNWVSQRPFIWKDAVSLTVIMGVQTNIAGVGYSSNVTFRVTDESGAY